MIKNKDSSLTTLFPQHASLSLLQKANQQIAKQRWGSFVLGTGQVAQILYILGRELFSLERACISHYVAPK